MKRAAPWLFAFGLACAAAAWFALSDESASPITTAHEIPGAAAPSARPNDVGSTGDTTQNAPHANAVQASHPGTEDASTLAQIGRTQLQRGADARRDGDAEKARGLFDAAAAALGKSIELAGDRVDPWTLANMAQAQVELGNGIEAVAWADRALQQLRQGSNDDYTQFRAAQLTMSVGIVYYRAGQKQTGIAYMDQAISMAPTEFDREDFRDLKEETIGA